MFATFSGQRVVTIGGDQIGHHIVQAFTAGGAACLHFQHRVELESLAEQSASDRTLEVFVHCSPTRNEIEMTFAELCRAFADGPRYVIAVVANPSPSDRRSIFVHELEAWCRWAAANQFNRRRNINLVLYRSPAPPEAQPFTPRHRIVRWEDVTNAVIALCSGLMDAVTGQTVVVDRGTGFCDNVMRLYAEREKWGFS